MLLFPKSSRFFSIPIPYCKGKPVRLHGRSWWSWRSCTPWSLNRLFRGTLVAYFGGGVLPGFYSKFPKKNSPKHPRIVSNTPKMTVSNFLKESLNSLFIDPGVIKNQTLRNKFGRVCLICFYLFSHLFVAFWWNLRFLPGWVGRSGRVSAWFPPIFQNPTTGSLKITQTRNPDIASKKKHIEKSISSFFDQILGSSPFQPAIYTAFDEEPDFQVIRDSDVQRRKQIEKILFNLLFLIFVFFIHWMLGRCFFTFCFQNQEKGGRGRVPAGNFSVFENSEHVQSSEHSEHVQNSRNSDNSELVHGPQK